MTYSRLQSGHVVRWTVSLLAGVGCASGEPKAGLGPNQPSLADVTVVATQASITTGEVVMLRAEGTTSSGQPVPVEVDWSASGGTIVPASDSEAFFSASNAGSYTVRAQEVSSPALQDSTTITVTPPVSPTVALTISPSSVTLPTGGVRAFSASAARQDGSSYVPSVNWAATGGTVTAGGLYTAGSTAGSFRVIATQQGGTVADTAAVIITATPPVLQAVILTPPSASLATGATQQFSVSGQWSNGATTAPAVTYSATGGTVTAGGLYTAGSTAGSFRVIATQQGGTLADTSTVTLTAPSSGPYANRPANYTRVLSDYSFGTAPYADHHDGPFPDGSGWQILDNPAHIPLARVSVPSAPVSAPWVLQSTLPAGYGSGSGYGGAEFYADASINEFYIAFSLLHDANYEFNPVSNKMIILEPGHILLESRHDNQYLPVDMQGNDTYLAPTNPRIIPLGQFVNYEYQIKRGPNGFVRVWMNGTLVTSYAGVNVPGLTGEAQIIRLSTTWGGGTGPSTRESYRQIDHILITTP